MSRATHSRWCITLNNYTDEDEEKWNIVFADPLVTRYAIYGREQGEQGTKHLQAFFILEQPGRLTAVKGLLGQRIHAEFARGSSKQAADYCKKENDFIEFGKFPGCQGKRTDIERFVEWIKEQERKPCERDVASAFPAIWTRYPRLTQLVDHLWKPPALVPVGFELNDWQRRLDEQLRVEPDDRSIVFVIDPEGGKGKSMFCRYQLSIHPLETQVLKLGKRDDLSYAIDESKRVFLFDIPRLGMALFQYNVVEQIKDQIIFSTKYMSRTKILAHKSHVVVFCNELPDVNAMTGDRYQYFTWNPAT